MSPDDLDDPIDPLLVRRTLRPLAFEDAEPAPALGGRLKRIFVRRPKEDRPLPPPPAPPAEPLGLPEVPDEEAP
jgi:hypothetical protein